MGFGRLPRDAQCTGKVRYQDRRTARRARRQIHPDDGGHLSIYRCPWCHTFHLGHIPHDPAVEDMHARQQAADEAAVAADLDRVVAEASARALGITTDEAFDLLREPS